MPEITESRLAMYEGALALAWVDGVMDDSEKQRLHQLINDNPRFNDWQRELLHSRIDKKTSLDEIWPRVTDIADRAHLIDMMELVFHADGEFCDMERAEYHKWLQTHLNTEGVGLDDNEVKLLIDEQRRQREKEEADAKAEAKQAFRAARNDLPGSFRRFFEIF